MIPCLYGNYANVSSGPVCILQLVEVATDPSGGVMKLAVQGFKDPVPIAVALPEAASLLFASGISFHTLGIMVQ